MKGLCWTYGAVFPAPQPHPRPCSNSLHLCIPVLPSVSWGTSSWVVKRLEAAGITRPLSRSSPNRHSQVFPREAKIHFQTNPMPSQAFALEFFPPVKSLPCMKYGGGDAVLRTTADISYASIPNTAPLITIYWVFPLLQKHTEPDLILLSALWGRYHSYFHFQRRKLNSEKVNDLLKVVYLLSGKVGIGTLLCLTPWTKF